MINLIKSIVSFYIRRIKIPVDRTGLVLDIGSGDKPHWRSDILVDKYILPEFGAQRSGSSFVDINKPTFVSDAEAMPFRDKIFDYVICSHLLEHVEHPDLVITEIMRVGKAGYIELPYEGSAKLLDFPSHLWYCKKNANKIIFTAKKSIIFDIEINDFILNTKLNFGKIPDSCIVQLHWDARIEYEMHGSVDINLMKEIENINIEYTRSYITHIIRSFIIFLVSTFFFYKKRNTPIFYNSIIKNEMKLKKDVILKNILYDTF